MFAPTGLAIYRLIDKTTGRRGLYSVPLASGSNHVHVWKSLLALQLRLPERLA
jgi:hypothetical protein